MWKYGCTMDDYCFKGLRELGPYEVQSYQLGSSLWLCALCSFFLTHEDQLSFFCVFLVVKEVSITRYPPQP